MIFGKLGCCWDIQIWSVGRKQLHLNKWAVARQFYLQLPTYSDAADWQEGNRAGASLFYWSPPPHPTLHYMTQSFKPIKNTAEKGCHSHTSSIFTWARWIEDTSFSQIQLICSSPIIQLNVLHPCIKSPSLWVLKRGSFITQRRKPCYSWGVG